MKFWLNKGVDIFRVDALWHKIKDNSFRDNPLNPGYNDILTQFNNVIRTYSFNQQFYVISFCPIANPDISPRNQVSTYASSFFCLRIISPIPQMTRKPAMNRPI